MITKDDYLPYDRTKLSKSLGIDWDKIKLRDEAWFEVGSIFILFNLMFSLIMIPFRRQKLRSC